MLTFSGLKDHSKPLFPSWFSVWSVQWCKLGDKVPNYKIVLLSISPFMSGNIYVFSHSSVACIDIYTCYTHLLEWSLPPCMPFVLLDHAKQILKQTLIIATQLSVSILMVYVLFLHFSLYVSSGLKRGSCRKHINGSFLLLFNLFNLLSFGLEPLVYLHLK